MKIFRIPRLVFICHVFNAITFTIFIFRCGKKNTIELFSLKIYCIAKDIIDIKDLCSSHNLIVFSILQHGNSIYEDIKCFF